MINKLKVLFYAVMAMATVGLLSGCDMVLFQPRGSIAAEQIRLIIIAVLLMLIVVVPVVIMTIVFAWRYRASNQQATYAPKWDHNSKLEIIWWTIPCIIIVILAWITWVSSHKLDPYKPLKSSVQPITIQAISLDWKWLFIYPEQHIATVNYLQIPEQTPVNFQITADAPMNSLWIPALGGQIYAMPGMRTKLHLIANGLGEYHGLSANFSGDGFSGMSFNVESVPVEQFNQWVSTVKETSANRLTVNAYDDLAKQSSNYPVTYYSYVPDGLFNRIIMKFMMPAGALDGMSDLQIMNMDMAKMMNGGGSMNMSEPMDMSRHKQQNLQLVNTAIHSEQGGN